MQNFSGKEFRVNGVGAWRSPGSCREISGHKSGIPVSAGRPPTPWGLSVQQEEAAWLCGSPGDSRVPPPVTQPRVSPLPHPQSPLDTSSHRPPQAGGSRLHIPSLASVSPQGDSRAFFNVCIFEMHWEQWLSFGIFQIAKNHPINKRI